MNSFLFGDRTWIDTMPTFKALLLKYPTPPDMTPPAGCKIGTTNFCIGRISKYAIAHNNKWIKMVIYTIAPEYLAHSITIKLESS